MMRTPLVITYEDGRTEQVTVGTSDFLGFERKYELPSSEVVTSGRLEYIWWTTWHALKRTKGISLDFESWVAEIESISEDDKTPSEFVPLESPAPTGS